MSAAFEEKASADSPKGLGREPDPCREQRETTALTSVLTRLLSDPALRESFSRNPSKFVRELGLSPEDGEVLMAVDPAELQRQADGLIGKRLHEVRAFLPETFRRLKKQVQPLFREYAVNYWPEGHRRHVDDAFHFGLFLRQRKIPEVCRPEWNWVAFLYRNQRVAVHIVRDMGFSSRRGLPALQIFWRIGGHPRWFRLYVP